MAEAPPIQLTPPFRFTPTPAATRPPPTTGSSPRWSTRVTSNLQLTLDQLNPTLLWAGEIPGPDTTTNSAIVLRYTAPNGATLIQETAFVEDFTGGYQIVLGALQPFPAGTAVEDPALLIRNILGGGSGTAVPVTSMLAIGPEDLTAPGPGRDVVLSALDEDSAQVIGDAPGGFQVTGFSYLTYTGDVAMISIAIALVGGGQASLPVTLEWSGNDWLMQIAADGNVGTGIQELPGARG